MNNLLRYEITDHHNGIVYKITKVDKEKHLIYLQGIFEHPDNTLCLGTRRFRRYIEKGTLTFKKVNREEEYTGGRISEGDWSVNVSTKTISYNSPTNTGFTARELYDYLQEQLRR